MSVKLYLLLIFFNIVSGTYKNPLKEVERSYSTCSESSIMSRKRKNSLENKFSLYGSEIKEEPEPKSDLSSENMGENDSLVDSLPIIIVENSVSDEIRENDKDFNSKKEINFMEEESEETSTSSENQERDVDSSTTPSWVTIEEDTKGIEKQNISEERKFNVVWGFVDSIYHTMESFLNTIRNTW